MIRKSLYMKISCLLLLTAAIPFLISNTITYYSTARTLEENMIHTNLSLMQQGVEHTIRYMNELEAISLQWYFDSALFQLMKKKSLNYEETTYLENKMISLLYSREELQAISYYSKQNGMNYIRTKDPIDSKYLEKQALVEEKLRERYLFIETATVGDEVVLYVHRKFVDMPKGEVLGYLTLEFSYEQLDLIQTRLIDQSNEQLFVLFNQADKLTVLYQTAMHERGAKLDKSIETALSQEKTTGYSQIVLQKIKGLSLSVHSEEEGKSYIIVKFIPKQNITARAQEPLYMILVVQFVTLLLIILLAMVVSYSIISPIRGLIRNMGRVEKGIFKIDNFKAREDEIGLLEKRFQVMVLALQDLILKQYKHRIELTTSQLKVLQAQINPHFLNNVLQTIGTYALKHGVPQIQERISELGAILRYSMDMREENVAFEKEIVHIQDYLSLQKSRYQERLHYFIESNADTRHIKVPKMILQPLVENCIIHGIEGGSGTGFIHVTSAKHGLFLIIKIIDSGKGLKAKELMQIHQQFNSNQVHSDREGIGLMNVLNRLSLAYGEHFTWNMTSVPYVETMIELRIPLDRG
jgi:two-component system sensor histidine kinase YesM